MIAADTDDAQQQFELVRRQRIGRFLARDRDLSEEELDTLAESPQGRQVAQMMHYSAVGTPSEVGTYLRQFAAEVGVDEVITAHASPTIEARPRSVDLVADALDPVTI